PGAARRARRQLVRVVDHGARRLPSRSVRRAGRARRAVARIPDGARDRLPVRSERDVMARARFTADATRTVRALALRALGLVVAGCGAPNVPLAPPRAQAVVNLTSDAPAPALVDRVRIVVLDHAFRPACAACVLERAIDANTRWPLSFGVVPAAD